MRPALHEMLAPAAIERLTLLINHVLGREPVAMERLKPHAGRVLLLQAEANAGTWQMLSLNMSTKIQMLTKNEN
jgi:ubiquinone biosynthesis protein UbiJ